jgi:hypothetical protein
MMVSIQAVCSKYSSQQYDRCAQGYSDGYNHFYRINSSVVATGAYVHTPEYKYGYKLGENYTVNSGLGLDATSCDTPYNTTQQLRTCKQGYLDGSNVIKQLFKQMPEYKIGYEIGKVDGNHT